MKIILATLLLLTTVILNAQSSCPNFTSSTVLPVKITVYTEAEECFTLTYNGEMINAEPSQRVVFYMNIEVGMAKMKMSDGQVVEKKIFVNADMAAATYEIVKNEKKGSFDVKNRFGQGEMTAEAKQKQQDDVSAKMEANKKKLADEQKARDDAWDAKMNQKAEEKQRLKAEEEKAAQEQHANALNSGNQVPEAQEASSSYISAKDEFPYRFLYNGVPIRSKVFTADYRDTESPMMSGRSNENGVVTFKTDLPYGVYKVDYKFNPTENTTISKLSYTVVLGDHEGKVVDIDFKEYVEVMAEMMGYDVPTMESLLGFDKLK